MANFDIVVWDFDGVLNRNIIDGRFVWSDAFEAEIGKPFDRFQTMIFDGPFKEAIVGRLDLLDLIKRWSNEAGYMGSPEEILDYWFRNDDLVDPKSLELLEAAERVGLRNVIATNNEARRAHYIEHKMGFDARVERLFASGRLGVAKPDPAFFETVSETLEVEPERLLLVDDSAVNVATAEALGWQAYHFQPGCYDILASILERKTWKSAQMMTTRRIHLTGASGAGVTTLGRALAQDLSIPHHDTDDYFWLPTNPPYKEKRPAEDRLTLMEALFVPRPDWVLSGSLNGWGDPLIPNFDAAVLVRTRTDVRLQRLRDREGHRYGPEAILPGGSMHEQFEAFIAWASGYDDDQFDGRRLVRHEEWLQRLGCPVIRVDGERPLGDLRNQVLEELGLRARRVRVTGQI